MRGADEVPTIVTPMAVPATSHASVSRDSLVSIRQQYIYLRWQTDDCGADGSARASGKIQLDALFDNDMLFSKSGNVKRVSKNALLGTYSLLSAMSLRVPMSRKDYLEI